MLEQARLESDRLGQGRAGNSCLEYNRVVQATVGQPRVVYVAQVRLKKDRLGQNLIEYARLEQDNIAQTTLG